MFYRAGAELVVLIHFGFILFVIFGGLCVLRWKWCVWLHIPAALWGAFIVLIGWVCPLTPLENWLREQGGESGYTEGFIEHYLLPVIYPEGLTRKVQVYMGIFVILFNLIVYSIVLLRAPGKGK